MAHTRTARTPFAAWLKGELDARGWGVRTLAKRMDPGNVEVARRALNRVIHEGTLPTDPTRTAIACGLGIDESEMPSTERGSSSDEDEEPHSRMTLDDFLRLRARQVLREEAEQMSPPRDLAVVTGTGSNQEGA